jgi:hypothetical protein
MKKKKNVNEMRESRAYKNFFLFNYNINGFHANNFVIKILMRGVRLFVIISIFLLAAPLLRIKCEFQMNRYIRKL